MEFTFEAQLWRWEAQAAWHFVSLPAEVADEIEDRFGGGPGFGSVRVFVRIGDTTWATSIFPDRQRATYVLPVKRQVRDREGLTDGDVVRVQLAPAD